MTTLDSDFDVDALAAAAPAEFTANEIMNAGRVTDTPTPSVAKLPPEPLDFFGDTSLTGAQEMTPDMLPAVIWNYAEDAAARPGLNIAAIVSGCLITACAAIREDWVIQQKLLDKDWVERPILWFGLTGSSGAKKTSAINAAVAPLLALEKDAAAEADDLRRKYFRDRAFYNEEMKVWRANFKRLRTGTEEAEPLTSTSGRGCFPVCALSSTCSTPLQRTRPLPLWSPRTLLAALSAC